MPIWPGRIARLCKTFGFFRIKRKAGWGVRNLLAHWDQLPKSQRGFYVAQAGQIVDGEATCPGYGLKSFTPLDGWILNMSRNDQILWLNLYPLFRPSQSFEEPPSEFGRQKCHDPCWWMVGRWWFAPMHPGLSLEARCVSIPSGNLT